jgi:hypothetical protein
MPITDFDEEEGSDLPPPGTRWGTGAESVLPFLTRSLQAKPAEPAAREQRAREVPPPALAN